MLNVMETKYAGKLPSAIADELQQSMSQKAVTNSIDMNALRAIL
jgi:hypothetical protein